VPSLHDDTLADKALRFALGALVGGGTTWYRLGNSAFPLLVAAGIVGLLFLLMGNGWIERSTRTGWWR
jgi:hypothetical protein